jgi:hypothetical protein
VLAHFRSLLKPEGVLYLSTPNVRTLSPKGADRSDNPWHLCEYDLGEFQQLCQKSFSQVELLGVFHARKLHIHELALNVGWDRIHAFLGITDQVYKRFVPAISANDFRLSSSKLEQALDFLAVCRP